MADPRACIAPRVPTSTQRAPGQFEQGASTVVAVVVHYTDAASTLRCIASLRAQRPAPRIVVVDNASPDGSGTVLANSLRGSTDVVPMCSATNGGFGAGCNLGITEALSRWPDLAHVLLLNPDAELAEGSLENLVATAARHPRAGIVGCRVDDRAGRPWFESGRWRPWTLGRSHTAPPHDSVEHRCDLVTGACMLIAADLLRRGLRFCEDYFLYCEDADLCREVIARGREVWVTRRARAIHTGGGSQPGEAVLGELSATRLYWLTRSKALLARRRLSPLQRAVFLLHAATTKPLAGVLFARSVRFLGPYLRGLRDGLFAPLGA